MPQAPTQHIQIPPNGARVMRDLGLLSQLLERGSQVQQVDFKRYKDGRILRSMPFGDDITQEFGAPWMYADRFVHEKYIFCTKFCLELFTGLTTIGSFLTKQSDLEQFFNWTLR